MPPLEAKEFADFSSVERSDAENSLNGFTVQSGKAHHSVGEDQTATTPRTKFKLPKCEPTPSRWLCL